MAAAGPVLRASSPVEASTTTPSDDPWVRWLSTPGHLVALVDAAGNVVEFLSYEGTMTALGGPADGRTSTDIGVAEPSSTPIGQSL